MPKGTNGQVPGVNVGFDSGYPLPSTETSSILVWEDKASQRAHESMLLRESLRPGKRRDWATAMVSAPLLD